MYRLVITARDFQELKKKLLDAAGEIKCNGVKRDFGKIEQTLDDDDMVLPESTPEIPFTSAETRSVLDEPTGEVDSKGVPWDKRIHSASKALSSRGVWRYRRNADPNLIARVEGELKGKSLTQKMAAAAPHLVAPNPLLDVPYISIPAIPMFQPHVVPPMPVFQQPQAPTPVIPTPVAAPILAPVTPPQTYDNIQVPANATKPAHTYETFKANFIGVLTGLINAKEINREYIDRLKTYFGIGEIWEITRPENEEKCRQLFDQFTQNGVITRVG